MARKGRKLHDGRKECQKHENKTPDLISKLPDHVIHHILSFLPTIDIVRMSLLSRRWRRMWYYVPALNFSDLDIKAGMFYSFLEQSLKQRQMGSPSNTNSVITRFTLSLRRPTRNWNSSLVGRWLSFVAQPCLQELHLNMSSNYCLPQVALNLRSLTILNLASLKLEDCSRVHLPSLKSLCLRMVFVEDEVLNNLLLGCPSLQTLFIQEQQGSELFSRRILSSSLKFLDMDGCWGRIQVEAINLESFVFHGFWECDFDLASCKKLGSLSITWVCLCDGDFENLNSGFPLLYSLTLKECNPVDIRHEYLKVLVLDTFEDAGEEEYEILIDAPNLVSLYYHGEVILPRIVLNTPNLLETNINLDLYQKPHDMEWYVNILNFLSCFKCSKSMSFILHSEETLIFPESLRMINCYSPLPNLKHVKVKTLCKLERESELRKALCWLLPSLETLTIEHEEKRKRA